MERFVFFAKNQTLTVAYLFPKSGNFEVHLGGIFQVLPQISTLRPKGPERVKVANFQNICERMILR